MLVTDRLYFVLATMSGDPFDYINGSQHGDGMDANGITTDSVILGMGMSWIRLMETIGAVGIVLSLIICGFKFILFRNDPRESTETKKELMTKAFIAIAVFSFVGLAGLAFDVATNFTK